MKKRASAAGYTVNKTLRLAGEVNGKCTLRASYLRDRTDVMAGVADESVN